MIYNILLSKLKEVVTFLGLKVDAKSRTRVEELNFHTKKKPGRSSEQGKICSDKEGERIHC